LAGGQRVPRDITGIACGTGGARADLVGPLNALSQQGLVVTGRGYRDGIGLARPAKGISMVRILAAVEGKDGIAACLVGRDGRGAHPTCWTDDFRARIGRQITEQPRGTNLAWVMDFRQSRRAPVEEFSQPARPGRRAVDRGSGAGCQPCCNSAYPVGKGALLASAAGRETRGIEGFGACAPAAGPAHSSFDPSLPENRKRR